MSHRNVIIRGFPKFVIVSFLAGVTLGLIGGAMYGDYLADIALAEELRTVQADPELNRLWEGRVDSKVESWIRAEGRGQGLRLGVALGLIGALTLSVVAAPFAWRTRRAGVWSDTRP